MSGTNSAGNRDLWVDHAKGLGMILMVYGHVAGGVCNAGLQCAPSHGLVWSMIYSFHMPLFFFLSGLYFLPTLARRGAGQLLANKVDTIAYPYVVWSLVQGVFEMVFSRYKNYPVQWADVLAFPWAPRMQFWYLYCLFWTFVAATLLYAVLPRKARPAVYLLAVVLYFVHQAFRPIDPLADFARCFVFLMLGVAFASARERFAALNSWLLPVLLVAGVAFQWVFHGILGLSHDTRELAWALPLAVLWILLMVSVSMVLSRFGLGWLAFIGQSSLYIYAMHTIFAAGVRAVLSKVLGEQGYGVHVAVGTLVGLLLPLGVMAVAGRPMQILFRPPAWLSISGANRASSAPAAT